MINVADLIDPNDKEGRTYREVNLSISHRIPLGSLVEIEEGVRLRVVKHARDCDGEPLYSLSINEDEMFWFNGYGEESLRLIEE